MKFSVVLIVLSLLMISPCFSQASQPSPPTTQSSQDLILVSRQTMLNWADALQKALDLLANSDSKITDLQTSLTQLNKASADLQQQLKQAQDTSQQSATTISQLQASLAMSAQISSKLQAKIDQQTALLNDQTKQIATAKTATESIQKDVSALQNQNRWLKIGIIIAVVVSVAGVVYGLAK